MAFARISRRKGENLAYQQNKKAGTCTIPSGKNALRSLHHGVRDSRESVYHDRLTPEETIAKGQNVRDSPFPNKKYQGDAIARLAPRSPESLEGDDEWSEACLTHVDKQ